MIATPFFASGQSETTQKFHKENDGAFVLFAYHNTLKMLTQVEGADEMELDELIKDIDKMKYVRVDTDKDEAKAKMKILADGFKSERFEDLMSMRHEGMNVNIYIQEDDGITTGLVMLMIDNESVSVLDVKGKVPLNKLGNLISQVQKMR